jgi:hypothetical protein
MISPLAKPRRPGAHQTAAKILVYFVPSLTCWAIPGVENRRIPAGRQGMTPPLQGGGRFLNESPSEERTYFIPQVLVAQPFAMLIES